MLAEIDQRHVVKTEVQCANRMPAFVACPDTPGPHPVMVLLHERYGLVDHTREAATRFAGHGHLTIAPNLFFREPDLAAIARAEARCDPTDDQVCADISAALDHLQGLPSADLQRVAVAGFCQTGRHPLAYSACADGSRLSACVVFHGAAYPREWELNAQKTVPYDELIARSRVPVFGAFGEEDFLISQDDVRRFRSSLEAARRHYDITVYPGAPHSWLNDRIPSYRQPQAETAWRDLLAFLDRVYTGGYPSDRVRWSFRSDTSTEPKPTRP
jgi:carboxymethylenebutenolidase